MVTAEPSSLLPKIKPVGKDSGEPQLWIRSRAGQDGQDTDLVVAIGISGDFACEAMDAALRLDTPSARAFLGQFVVLP